MSIRTVKCPQCGTTANVPVGMTNVKCGSCGSIWNVNNPSRSSGASPATKATKESNTKNSSGGSANKQTNTLIAAIAGVLATLAIAGIAVAFLVMGSSDPEPAPVVIPERVEPAPVVSAPIDPTPTYREVNLPESTRQAIYLDYRRLVESSTEKKIKIMKESPVNKSLQSMLGKTVDRDVTHFSLIHNITEDDVMQIIAEGEAKLWPGSRPPKPQETVRK